MRAQPSNLVVESEPPKEMGPFGADVPYMVASEPWNLIVPGMKERTKPLSHYGFLQRVFGLPNHPEEMRPIFSKLLFKFQFRVAFHPWFLGLILHLEAVYSFWNSSFWLKYFVLQCYKFQRFN
jgi:hypothetical protein